MPKALPTKQEKFCRAIVADPKANGTKAAEDAGYSPRSAASIASELLKKPSIKARIKELNKASIIVSEVSARRVVEELELLALSDMGQFVDFREGEPIKTVAFDRLPRGATRCVKKFKMRRRLIEGGPVMEETCEIELWSKTDALDMLARKHGLFDGVDVTDNRTFNFSFVKATKKAGG